MDETREWLRSIGLPGRDHELPSSPLRFADGGQYRVEIPSVEGPRVLDQVLAEAADLGVEVHRISQGSGGLMLSDDELREMAAMAAARHVEVSLFARPTAGWGIGAMAYSPAGSAVSAHVRGADGLVHCLEDIRRTAAAGIRSVLISDLGVLATAQRMRASGRLPADLQFKCSVLMGLSNLKSDVERNTELLTRRNWIDLPIRYASGQRAIVSFEKGISGDQIMAQAFASWQ